MARQTAVIKQCSYYLNQKGFSTDETVGISKVLLKRYGELIWLLNDTADRLESYSNEFGSNDLSTGLIYLDTFAPIRENKKFNDVVQTLKDGKSFMGAIEYAIDKSKTYPDYGKIYFDILDKQFRQIERKSEKEMLIVLNLERSVFYNRKNEAYHVFAMCLFDIFSKQRI